MIENLSSEVIEAIFEALPVEISFVDKEDAVRFFNKGMKRIFPRSESVLGRKVQDCHPRKSLHAVNRILSDFKNGTRDHAAFWIDLKGRKIYIRYFPVRDKNNKYLGSLEVTQDVAEIQTLKGQKRLLDA